MWHSLATSRSVTVWHSHWWCNFKIRDRVTLACNFKIRDRVTLACNFKIRDRVTLACNFKSPHFQYSKFIYLIKQMCSQAISSMYKHMCTSCIHTHTYEYVCGIYMCIHTCVSCATRSPYLTADVTKQAWFCASTLLHILLIENTFSFYWRFQSNWWSVSCFSK